jgi:hypothetical protein
MLPFVILERSHEHQNHIDYEQNVNEDVENNELGGLKLRRVKSYDYWYEPGVEGRKKQDDLIPILFLLVFVRNYVLFWKYTKLTLDVLSAS